MKNPRWSQKTYELVAGVIFGYSHNPSLAKDMTDKFITIFEKDNEKFDKEIFLKACGVKTQEDS